MDLGLRGKVALVSASSKGLGFATARELAAEGASLAMCARGEAALETARRAVVDETSADVLAIAADVATTEGVEQVTRAALERFGHVDILVINAGGPPAGTFDKHDWKAWQAAVDLTLRSAVELTRAVLPGMRERRWGRIVAINSIAAKQPVDNLMFLDVNHTVYQPAFTLVNASTSYRAMDRVEVYASVNNATDVRYADNATTSAAGEILGLHRSFTSGLRLRF